MCLRAVFSHSSTIACSRVSSSPGFPPAQWGYPWWACSSLHLLQPARCQNGGVFPIVHSEPEIYWSSQRRKSFPASSLECALSPSPLFFCGSRAPCEKAFLHLCLQQLFSFASDGGWSLDPGWKTDTCVVFLSVSNPFSRSLLLSLLDEHQGLWANKL